MPSKLRVRRYFWVIPIAALVACGKQVSSITPTSGTILTMTVTPALSFTPVNPTSTILSATSTQTLLPFVVLEGLRVAYNIDGNLYVQDSGKEPVQLTDSGLDRAPMFSDDGERIVFYRGEAFEAYSIHADGGQEQALALSGLLTKLSLGYSEYTRVGNIAFVPGTHQILFNTSEVKPWSDSAPHMSPMDVQPNRDMLLMDIDAKEIKRLLAPGEGGAFQISLDGKLEIDYTGNYIDAIGIYGQINRRRMITYQPDWDYEWTDAFWAQDSSKFIFVAPRKGNADPADGPEPDTIWQYFMESDSAVEIRLDPPPMDRYFSLSPDGNWIAYSYFYYPGKTEETIPSGIYLGNLRDVSSRFLGLATLYGSPDSFVWSPDSEHFIFENDRHTGLYMGSTEGDITLLSDSGFGAGWIDDHRYVYFPSTGDGLELIMGEIGREGNAPVVDLPVGLTNVHTGRFTYVFVKPK